MNDLGGLDFFSKFLMKFLGCGCDSLIKSQGTGGDKIHFKNLFKKKPGIPQREFEFLSQISRNHIGLGTDLAVTKLSGSGVVNISSTGGTKGDAMTIMRHLCLRLNDDVLLDLLMNQSRWNKIRIITMRAFTWRWSLDGLIDTLRNRTAPGLVSQRGSPFFPGSLLLSSGFELHPMGDFGV